MSPQYWTLDQVAIAMGLGAVLGAERESHGKPAGVRTHMLVAGAAALLVGMGDVVVESVDQEAVGVVLRADPLRLIEAVVAGVSFLGAGTIIRRQQDDEIEGLTTAAAMLVTAGVGVCVALSQYVVAIGVTLLVLITLALVGRLDAWLASRLGA
jgi:putative Mg2+ transporter-C (MgtC) family protein